MPTSNHRKDHKKKATARRNELDMNRKHHAHRLESLKQKFANMPKTVGEMLNQDEQSADIAEVTLEELNKKPKVDIQINDGENFCNEFSPTVEC